MILRAPIQNLIDAFSRLPGIGPKTASRLTFFLLNAPEDVSVGLSDALRELKSNTVDCPICFNVTNAGRTECEVCASSERDPGLVCVVEEPLDVLAMERTGGFQGWYHVLRGATERIFADPLSVLRIWEGGMSFHGGLVGVLVALAMLASRRGKPLADVFDFTAPLPAIGFGAGRIGNFINGELWGKPTDVPWAVVVDGVPLHASQLYEAFSKVSCCS